MTDITIGPAITRATNDLQARVKQWWKYHPEAPRTLAVVSECGYEPEPGFLHCGVLRHNWQRRNEAPVSELVGIFYEEETQQWYGVLDEGFDVLLTGDYERDFYGDLQGAFLAITGMKDELLAQLLGTKPHIIKTWYTSPGKPIPVKFVKAIAEAFLHDSTHDCVPLKKPKRR